MKKSLLLSTLIAASFAFASTAWAEEYTLNDGDSLAGLDGTTALTFEGDTISVESGTISSSTEWGTTDHMGAWIHWTNDDSSTDGSNYRNKGGTLGSSSSTTTITGSGFLGLVVRAGSTSWTTSDLTNVDASGFTGQLCVINTYAKNVTVQLKGDWSGTEYVFGGVTAEWANASGTDSASVPYHRGYDNGSDSNNDHDTLALQDDTTLAGITGTSKGFTASGVNVNDNESITVNSAGTTLTIAGSGEYAFYGTAGTDSARMSLAMNSTDGSGSQTFGGTNYLQDVTVTAGTLALGGTTSIAGSVSVAANSTLALSGEVTLAETIQNSGTVTIDSSTVFVLDNLSYEGSLDTGATFTLITGSSGSVTMSGDLDINNVSSATSTIESASFEYTDGVLKVTVTELSNGLQGDGGSESPYYTTGSGTVIITVSGDSSIFTGANTTVYLATDEKSFGTASMQIYWGGAFTAECDIVIGAAGVYITDGSGGQSHKFTGAISGAGDFTVTHNGDQGAGVNQDYCFTGDLSEWTGNFTIDTTSTSDYVCYGDGATVAATDTNVTGTGAVSVATGTIAFDYVKEDESGNTGPTTVTIGNSSLTAAKFEFVGDVNYIVSANTTITSASSSGSFVVSTEGGTVTILGTLTTGNANNSFSSLSVAEGSTLRIGATNTFYMDTTSTSGDVFVVSGTLEVAEGVSFTVRKRTAATNYSIANLKLENDSTFTLYTEGNAPTAANQGLSIGTLSLTGTSANLTISNHANYVSIGEIIGTSVNLTITVNTASSRADLVEFGSSTHDEGYESTSQFTGTITMVETSSTGDGRAFSMAISEENILAGAVIVMGSENSNESLSLGINAERVEIAGLSSEQNHNGADILYSGIIGVDAQVGNNGANITSGSSTNTLAINVADTGTYTFYGKVLNNLNLEKLGGGSQTISFESGSSFDGSIAVKAGTLALSGADISSSGITVDSGATLNIANDITLTKASDLSSCTSTISGNLGLSGTLTVSSDATLEIGSTASVTINSAISNSGTITIAEGASIVVGSDLEMGTYSGTNGDVGYYVLIDGSNGSGSVELTGSVTFVIGDESVTLNSLLQRYADSDTWNIYSDGGYLVIYAGTEAEVSDLTWAGTSENYTWNTDSSNTIWKNDTDGESVAFTTDSNVTFDSTAENKSVVLGESIEAGSITVTGTGYEFSGNFTLTANELILADEDSGDHTFTIAEDTTVEVGKLTEDVGQMNLVVDGYLNVTESMHIDSSENEVISGSGRIEVKNFTYDAAQGSSLTITVSEFSFSDFVEKPSGEDDASSDDYRTLIIGSEDGVIPDDAEYSTEVSGAYAEISGKSEVRVNKNSMFGALAIHNYSDYDLLISGDGLFYANEFNLAGKGTLIISCAEVEAGVVKNSKENIVIETGGQLAVGDFEHTTIVEDDDGVSYAEGLLNLQVDGTFIVDILEDYVNPTGTLSFGTEDSDTKLEGSHSISGKGTANIYKLEYGADGAGLEISVANLNIGAGGISAAEGASSLVLDGVTVGVYAGLDEENTSWSTEANLTLKNGVTFNTETGESITLAGAVETDEGSSLTKTGEGDLILAGEATLSGLTVSGGTLSVATGASLALSGEVTLATAISNSGTITIAEGTSFVINGITMGTTSEGNDYYVVITGGDGASLSGTIDISAFSGVELTGTWSVYSENGYLVIYGEATSDEKPANIYWAGSDGNSTMWVADGDSIIDWSGSDGGEAVYSFADGDAVIFGTAAESKTVAVSGTVAPGSITINDEYTFNKDSGADSALVQTSELTFGDGGKLTIGDDVTVQIVRDEPLSGFSVDGKIEGTGTLQLELSSSDYSATVNLGTQNEFAGTVYITAGNFTLNGSDIGNGTYRLGDGVNMQVTSSGVEVGNNFILEGTSQVHVNSNDSLTINGSITGVAADDGEGNTVMGGVFDRQGAGALTINGDVDIGTFIIDTSGSDAVSETTFSGESVTIGKLDVEYADSVVFSNENGSVTISEIDFVQAGTIEFANGGTVGKIDLSTANGAGTIIVSGGTLDVGTIENTFTNTAHATTLEVAEGAVLHAEKIDIAPGSAGSVYSTISGTEEGSGGTVIADSFIVGAEASTSGGTSIEVSDVTLVVGAISFGNGANSNLNLYLKNATLGFTEDVTISATTANNSTSRFVLGGFASGNSTATGSGTTTTINTSRYDVETGTFTSTGVTVTISQIISGQGELAVDGVGKLILSGANEYSGGTTIKEGATVVVQNESALGSGKVSVESGATLELDTHVTVDAASSNVTFAAGASIVLGGDLLQEIIASADTQEAVAVITANDISFGGEMASNYGSDSDGLTTIVSQYVTSNQYGITWSWSEGTLWAVASIPEPSMFGVFLGLGALGLVATRRRRRKAA